MQFPTDSATDVSSEPDKKGSNLSKVLCAQLWQSDILSVNTALSCLMCILNFNFHSVCQGSVADKIMSPFYFKLTINLVHFKVLLCFSKRLRTARHTFITNYPPGCNFKNTFLLQVGSLIFFQHTCCQIPKQQNRGSGFEIVMCCLFVEQTTILLKKHLAVQLVYEA